MRAGGGGSVINQSSGAAYVHPEYPIEGDDLPSFHYSVTKAALNAMTHYMAGCVGKYGIRVNAIAPGPTNTEATRQGVPEHIRSDNGPEFVATAILRWLQAAQIETAFIDPGKPWQNGTDESFNGKLRHEYLSLQWFRNRVEARVGIEQWRRHYNDVRPHSSLGYLTPLEFKATCAASVTEGRSPASPARADREEQKTEGPITSSLTEHPRRAVLQ